MQIQLYSFLLCLERAEARHRYCFSCVVSVNFAFSFSAVLFCDNVQTPQSAEFFVLQ